MTRYEAWKSFAALVSIPAFMFGAAVFDPGALGQIMRAAIELTVK